MSLRGSHPRAESLKTDLKRGLGSSSSIFKTTHGSSEGLWGSGLWRWIGDETGNVYRHKANANCWLRAGERKPHCLDAGLSPLGRNVPGVCYEGMSPTEDIDSGMFPFAVRMASTRPIFFSGLFCFVLLSWINRERERERVIHFSGKTGYGKILQVTTKLTCFTYNNIYQGAQQYMGQTPPWCSPSPIPLACFESLANFLVSLDLSFLRW